MSSTWGRLLAISACAVFTVPVVASADETKPSPTSSSVGVDVVRMVRSTRVYAKPRAKSRLNRGRVARAARFRVLERSPRGKGCGGPWLRIGNEAWICSRSTRATDAPPSNTPSPRLRPKRLLPHTYAVIKNAHAYPTLADAAARTRAKRLAAISGFIVRDVRKAGGVSYVKTKEGWIPRSRARIPRPSSFRGIALTEKTPSETLAFVTSRRARLYDERGKPIRAKAKPRQFFIGPVGPKKRVGRHRLRADKSGNYYRTKDIGVVSFSPRPKGVAADEHWLDVVMSQQTMVAYQGDRPVLATLVSTARTATPKGVFRISRKRAFARMRSSFGGPKSWDVFTPWVMTLEGPIAMHATYSHNQFGKPRSHGCINLSPSDAKWMWGFTKPQLPPGWMRIESTKSQSGTVIRIR